MILAPLWNDDLVSALLAKPGWERDLRIRGKEPVSKGPKPDIEMQQLKDGNSSL